MKCEHVEELMPAYIDGELEAADRQRVDSHLETCETCRESMALFAGLESALQSRRALLPSSSRAARQIARRVGYSRSWYFLPALRSIPAMISAGLIAIGALLFTLRGPVAGFIANLGSIHMKTDVGREASSLLLGVASAGSVLTWSIVYAGVFVLILLSGSWMVLRFVRH